MMIWPVFFFLSGESAFREAGLAASRLGDSTYLQDVPAKNFLHCLGLIG